MNEKQDIKVSVILPVYNVEKYIDECIKSIIGQTLKEIEIIFVDDGSTDGSYSKILQYSDTRIKILRQENSGSGIARNLGLKHAEGEFVIFIDPDDFYPSADVLETLYLTAKEQKALVVSGNMQRVNENGEFISNKEKIERTGFLYFINEQDYYAHQKYLINRDFLITNNIFYPPYRRFQDPPFLARTLFYAKKYYVIDKIVYSYRIFNSANRYFNKQRIFDLLSGVTDLMEFAKINELKKIQHEIINDFPRKYLPYIYKFLINDTDGIEAIEKFNDSIDYNDISVDFSVDGMKKIHGDSILYLDYMRKVLFGKKVIIYGAGIIGRRLEIWLKEQGIVVKSFAVTKRSDDQPDNVHELSYYESSDSDDVFMIAVLDNLQMDEMRLNLESKGIKNYYCLETTKFIYAFNYRELEEK